MIAPKKLYKYCPVGVYSLRAISEAEVFHSSPRSFNDPLDCNPTLQVDDDDQSLIRLAVKMLSAYMSTEAIEAWMDELGPDKQYIKMYELTNEMRDAITRGEIISKIKEALDIEFGNKGVLPMSETWKEPLLWSHYADQHRGIAIEYDTSEWRVETLGKVNYNAPRSIRTHDLYRWKVDGDSAAQKRVYDTYFFAKAREWEYEREWRDINDKAGVNVLHFNITAIYFGLRCDPVWQRTIGNVLSRNPEVQLYEMHPRDTTFELTRRKVDRNALDRELGQIAVPPFKLFGNIFESRVPTNERPAGVLNALYETSVPMTPSPANALGGIFGLAGRVPTPAPGDPKDD
jgi:hypothetical protein